MENCKHISRLRPKWNQSLLNPQKWMCYVCGTTESVWACLLCPVVACGRFTAEHALKHFQESKHPLSIEVNNKYVYCYECDDYVLNDNASGDLKLLRSTLMAITTQSFGDVETRGKRLLRSYSYSAVSSSSKDNEEDKLATAKCHYSKQLLGKVFTAWHNVTQEEKARKQQKTPRKRKLPSISPPSPFLKKRTLIPGVTGLRNLGNTCYMNSVLQVLSHLEHFRDFFIELESSTHSRLTTPERTPVSSPFSTSLPSTSSSPTLLKRLSSRLVKVSPSPSLNISIPASSSSSPVPPGLLSSATPSSMSIMSSTPRSTRYLSRQTTVECFKHLMTPIKSGSSTKVKGGLNGGSAESTPLRRQLIHNVESKNSTSKISLCQELNGLFRVLWSGRWAQVSPHAFLQSVWQMIPTFKGHAQHDAQEFLCELLDKVKTELEVLDGNNLNGKSALSDITNSMFEGELVSQVTCLECGNVSERTEPYLDLSLEFPDRYQFTTKNSRIAEDMCHVTEMLAKFTDEESLEGKIYQCDKCNSKRNDKKGTTKTTIYTEAKKRLLVKKLPHVLRLHLKRFRWSGRLHREKINTHVAFNDVIDMKPFCDLSSLDEYGYEYKLHSVIMHHGKGFGCGHYTAFCWNQEAGSWVNCNDSRMLLCQWEEVVMSQAYILFYVKQDTNFNMNSISDLAQPLEEEGKIFLSLNSHQDASISDQSISEEESFHTPESSLKKNLSQIVDNEITFNFKTPELLSQTSRKRTSTETLDLSKRVIKRRRSTFW